MSDIFATQGQKIKDNKLSDFSNRLYEGDYIPDNEVNIGGLMTRPIQRGRIYVLVIIMGIVFLFVAGYLIWLQGIFGQSYKDIAEGNRIRLLPIKADRGLIYDRNLRPLVKNIPNFSLMVVPGDLPKNKQEKEQVRDELLSLLKFISVDNNPADYQYIVDLFDSLSPYSYQPIVIIEHLDYQSAINSILRLNELPGIALETSAQREYLQDSNLGIFSHILGYVGKISPEELEKNQNYLLTDLTGKMGLELYYEDLLKGIDGQKRIEVNSLGKEERIESYERPKTGQDLILSIDSDLQKKAAEVLTKYLSINNSRTGAVVALNPQTGEVLSIFSWPSYDNNIFITGSQDDYQNLIDNPDKPFVFRSIAGEYASGSVIKPVIAAGALAEGIINKRTTINSYGGIQVSQWFFADWKKGGHGPTDLVKALAESVNTFFYYIGGGFKDFKGLGIEMINHYARLFGLTEKTGIDLPGESFGFLADPEWKQEIKKERWYIGDTYHIAIGQGDILVTPIQVANYTAAIANGGTLFRPYLVKSIKDSETGEEKHIHPEIIRHDFIEIEHIDLIKKGLKAAVNWGSARRLASLPMAAAGKTGTAQVGGDKRPHAWFTGFVPYENPEIVLTILIESGGEGSAAAVPAAKEIFKFWIENQK